MNAELFSLSRRLPLCCPFLLALALILTHHAVQADPFEAKPLVEGNRLATLKLMKYKFNRALALKGWQVMNGLYLGSTSIGGKSGPGLILDRGKYAYAINHQQVSFSLRF